MLRYDQIREIHLEVSSLCNARCPLCPRNLNGYPYNNGYTETNLTLAQCRRIFNDSNFIKQLDRVYINGNFGDAVMNPETPDIVEYFKSQSDHISVTISTNGSARSKKFWQRLAQANANVEFCLDGLADTHHLYRQNTNWQTVINNAKTFIAAGGKAFWKMIRFDHNLHQIESCRKLSAELGFASFMLVDDNRNAGPVFDKQGNLVHVLGASKYQGETSFKVMFVQQTTNNIQLDDVIPYTAVKKEIRCYTKMARSIYVDSTANVYPCCWTGFNPQSYGKGSYHEAINAQLKPLLSKNNALEHPIKECIEWFGQIEESWAKESFNSGRLVCCNDNCGIA